MLVFSRGLIRGSAEWANPKITSDASSSKAQAGNQNAFKRNGLLTERINLQACARSIHKIVQKSAQAIWFELSVRQKVPKVNFWPERGARVCAKHHAQQGG
jgi:hypothetical protein